MFCFRNDCAGSALLVHAEQVVQRTRSVTKRLCVGDGRYDVGFREKNGLGKSATKRKMARQGRRKSAPGAVRGSRALPLSLEDFLFDSTSGRKAEQVDGFV
jgi:hypothetical protein